MKHLFILVTFFISFSYTVYGQQIYSYHIADSSLDEKSTLITINDLLNLKLNAKYKLTEKLEEEIISLTIYDNVEDSSATFVFESHEESKTVNLVSVRILDKYDGEIVDSDITEIEVFMYLLMIGLMQN